MSDNARYLQYIFNPVAMLLLHSSLSLVFNDAASILSGSKRNQNIGCLDLDLDLDLLLAINSGYNVHHSLKLKFGIATDREWGGIQFL
jgi:hypothetical protein